jgi:hypothetical protein
MKDSEKQKKEKSGKAKEPDPDSSNIFQSSWIRRIVRLGDEMDRILLENRPYLLLHIGILFWFVVLPKPKI